MRGLRALAAVLLLAAGAAAVAARTEGFRANWGHVEVECGEMLLHGRSVPRYSVSYSMPFGALTSALLFGHWGEAASRRLWGAVQVAIPALAAGAALLAAGPVAGAAAFLAAATLGARHAAYPVNAVFAVFMLLVAGTLARREREPTAANGLLLGLALGISVLQRSPLVFFPAVLLALDAARGRGRRPAAAASLAPAAATALLLLPWIKMNWDLHGEFVPLERWRIEALLEASLAEVEKDLGGPRAAAYLQGLGGSLGQWAAGMLAAPASYAAACLGRARFIAAGSPFLLAGAAAGVLLGRRRPEVRALGALAGYYIGAHCLIAISKAYLVQLWPLLAVLCGVAAAELARLAPEAPDARADVSRAFALLTAAALIPALWSLGLAAAYPARVEASKPDDRAPDEAWPLYEEGTRLLARGLVPEAGERLARSVELRPGEPRALLLLAWAEALQGRPRALREFDAPVWMLGKAVPWLLKASESLEAGRAERARAELDRALAASAPGDGALRQLSDVMPLIPAKRLDRLLGALAERAPPGEAPDVRLRVAVMAAGRGDRAGALARLARLEKAELGNDEAEEAATLLASLKEERRALAVLSARAQRAPGDARPHLRRAEIAHEFGIDDEARASLAAARALARRAEERRRVAVLVGRLGDPAGALKLLAAAGDGSAPDVMVERAGFEAELGREAEARRLLSAALARDPGSSARRRAAWVYAQLDDVDAAAREIELLRRESPAGGSGGSAERESLARLSAGVVGSVLGKAEAALAAGRREEAGALLAKAAPFLSSPDHRRRAAELSLRMGDAAGAVEAIRGLEREKARDAELLIELAAAQARAGRREEALSTLARAAGARPDARGRRRAAGLYADLKEYRLAAAELEELIRLSPDDASARIELAEIEANAGRRPEALAALAAARAAAKIGAVDRRRAAALYRRLGENVRADEELAALARRLPGESGTQLDRAESLERLGRRADAQRALSDAAAGSLDAPSRRRAAAVYARLGETKKAQELLRGVARDFPGDAAARLELAELAARAGARRDARAHLDAAAGLPAEPAARRRAASLLRELGEPARSLDALAPLLRERPGDAELLVARGEAEAALGRREAALASLSAAESAADRDVETLLRAAHARQQLKDLEGAVRALDLALAADPKSARALSDRGLCRQLAGRGAQAEADLRRAIELDPDHLPAYLTLGTVLSSAGRGAQAAAVYDAALARPAAAREPALRELLRAARKGAR